MAVYNCEEYVGEAIESVQAQTIEDWELLCVDDCSTDRSAEIVAGYARRDPRIRLIRNERNMGAPRTRNVALEHARGEFIAVLDSDDIATPRRFELSLAAFDDDEALGVVGGMWDVIDDSGAVTSIPDGGELQHEPLRDSLLHHLNRLPHSSAMIRAELMKRIGGYDTRLPASQDLDLFVRLLPHCRYLRRGERFLSYRQRDGSISRDRILAQRLYADFARRRAHAALRQEPFDEQAELEEIEGVLAPDHGRSLKAARHLNGAALVALYWGEPRRARELLRSARDYWPFNPQAWFSSVLTYLPAPVISWLGGIWRRAQGREV